MRFLFHTLCAVYAGFFLTSTLGATTVFAQDAGFGGGMPPSDQATLAIRDGSTVIWTGTVDLPGGTTSISPTAGGGPYDVSEDSVLAVLVEADAGSDDFEISDLQYSGAFNSFYLNCIVVPADPANPLCGNWQYVVNGTSPANGMDVQTLSSDDQVYVYFGPSRRITPSSSSVTTGVPFTVLAESYVASSDSWTPAVGFTTTILQGDPFSSPTIISTAVSGADGNASFTINSAGSYTAGLLEDWYYPNASITASATAPSGPSTTGGGINLHAPFDIPRALAFITNTQQANGSFDSILLSDWVAIAFAGGGAGDAQKKLARYFIDNPPSFENITDFERHAMALEALGINPYSGTPIDYITPIVKSFDGTQIGDPALVNDDIFAVFPLLHAGYTSQDNMIRKVTTFIISKQLANGSWENSVDMTAAAIQALSIVRQLPDALSAITAAIDYLHGQEKADGGFGDSFATSWALQAISTQENSHLVWGNGYRTPSYYLSTLQQTDGGVEPVSTGMGTRLWATAYAIPAIQKKTWHSLLSSFNIPAVNAEIVQIATSTPLIATVTADVPVKPEVVSEAPKAKAIETVETKVEPKENVSETTASSDDAATEDPSVMTSEEVKMPANVQAAAAATISSNPLWWLLFVLFLILTTVLTLLVIRHRAKIHQQFREIQEK
jgi:hypothetical protein